MIAAAFLSDGAPPRRKPVPPPGARPNTRFVGGELRPLRTRRQAPAGRGEVSLFLHRSSRGSLAPVLGQSESWAAKAAATKDALAEARGAQALESEADYLCFKHKLQSALQCEEAALPASTPGTPRARHPGADKDNHPRWDDKDDVVYGASTYATLVRVAQGESVIKYKSALNVRKDTYDYSCYRARLDEYWHLMTDSPDG